MGRVSLWVLLGLTMFALSLQDVQVRADVGPSESECRPYIEKAIHELKTGETTEPAESGGDSQEQETSAEDTGGEVASGEQTAEGESAEQDTGEADDDDDTTEDAVVETVEDADDDTDEKDDDEKEPEQADEADGDDEDDDDEQKTDEDDGKSEEGKEDADDDEADDTKSEEEETGEKVDEDGKSEEDKEDDQDDTTASEEKEDTTKSGEDDDEGTEEAEGQDDDDEEGASQEEKDESKAATGDEESGETQDDQPAESVEDKDDDDNDGDDKDDDTDDDEEKDEEGKSEEEQTTEETEASKEETEAADDDKDDDEDEEKSKEQAADEDDEDDESDNKTEEDKDDDDEKDDEEEEVKSRGKRSIADDDDDDDDEPSKEKDEDDKESGEDVETEGAKDDEDEGDSQEGDTKEDDDDDEKDKDGDGKDDDDEEDEQDDEKSEEESQPEDDLLLEVDIPENLRDRKHIDELLHLDDEFEEKEQAIDRVAEIILRDLKRIYENAVKPLETLYKYRDLSNRHFSDPEIFSKPLILFMGPWSGGKSTIINYLTENEYTLHSLRSGAEPSPAYFNIVMHGNETEVLDGTQLAADWTFSGLQKFGQGLEDRLRGLKLPNKLLEKVNIVEIPGILEVRKQVSRLFPFNDACQWFIDRADIIFLVYDPAKLDVGPETEAILDQLKGREYQTRIILNKADTVKPEELLRVQSALIWNISPLMSSAQPPVMYTTSLWSHPYETSSPIRLLQAQERAFLRDIRGAIDKRIENKIASARRFAVRVRNHAKMVDCYLTTYYNHKTLFGNKKRISDQIIENPQNYHIYEGLSTLTNISRYDLPDPEVYRDFFRLNPLYEFKKLSETCTYFRGCPINKLDVAIAYDLPELVGKYKKMAESALTAIDSDDKSKS